MRTTPKLGNIAAPLKLGCLIVALMLAGCVQVNSKLPEQAPLKPEPVADDAMRMRNFGLTRAYCQSAEVIAGPTEWAFSVKNNTSPWLAVFADPGLFIVNCFASPGMVFIDPPQKPIHYEGYVVKHVGPDGAATKDPTLADPSYTGALPIPPSPQGPPKLSSSLVY